MRQFDGSTFGGGVEGRGQRDVLEIPPGQLQLPGQEIEVDVRTERRLRRKERRPDLPSMRLVREGEFHADLQSPQERLIEVLAKVGGEDGQAVVLLHPLEEVADLDVGEAIVGILDLRALAEQRIGLVEEEDGVGLLCGGEDPLEILLRLADVLADDLCQVDPVEGKSQLVGDDRGGHRLAGTRWAGEQDVESSAVRKLAAEAPDLVDLMAMSDPRTDLLELSALVRRQHQVVPAVGKGQLTGERRQNRSPGRRPLETGLPARCTVGTAAAPDSGRERRWCWPGARVRAQQPADRSVVELEVVRQQRRPDLSWVADQVEEPAPDERSCRAEVAAAREPIGGRRAQQVERQVYRRPATGDVV